MGADWEEIVDQRTVGIERFQLAGIDLPTIYQGPPPSPMAGRTAARSDPVVKDYPMPRIVLKDPWWALVYRMALRLRDVARAVVGVPMSGRECAFAWERARRTIDLHRKVSFR
jgi:hypothetical protein